MDVARLMNRHHVFRPAPDQDGGAMIIRRTREATPAVLGARWTHATDLLAREAQLLGERRLTAFQRRRAVRRIQSLERVARRAMYDYRAALERELSASLSSSPPGGREHLVH
jgi:hypothetical protein